MSCMADKSADLPDPFAPKTPALGRALAGDEDAVATLRTTSGLATRVASSDRVAWSR